MVVSRDASIFLFHICQLNGERSNWRGEEEGEGDGGRDKHSMGGKGEEGEQEERENGCLLLA